MRSGIKVTIASRGGFTLVELLVSVALTVFMLTLFATLFSAGNDAVRVARGTGEVDRSVQGAITKLRRDLQFVYVGDNVSLGKAFSSADQIPTAGYFTIEENMPASPPYYLSDEDAKSKITDPALLAFVTAIQARVGLTPTGYSGYASPTTLYRQGIDERGLPVEVDVDDVLAFTVKLTGNSPENIMYGKVPVGSILDSDLDPGSRFDQPDNGIFTSPYAEVAYFLRPNRPYTVAEISRPALGSDDGKIQTPATYTLYRRELLLLSPQQRNKVEKRLSTDYANTSVMNDMGRIIATGGSAVDYLKLNPSLNSVDTAAFNPSFYHNYDVSAYFGYDSKKDSLFPATTNFNNTSFYSLRFNDPTTVRLRQNRFGMQWISPAPVNSYLLISPDAAAPGYDHPIPAVARMYIPGTDIQWHGRPTLYESTMVGSEGFVDANYNPMAGAALYSALGLTNNSSLFYTATSPQQTARRNDADVLLTNVLSFDVKVLNDDLPQGLNSPILGSTALNDFDPIPSGTGLPFSPPDPMNWPGARTAVLPSFEAYFDVQPKTSGLLSVYRPNVVAGNVSRPWSNSITGAQPSLGMLQTEFVDIGNSFAMETAASWLTGFPRCVVLPSVVSSSTTFAITPPVGFLASPWGTHTPARWLSAGRQESSLANYAPGQPLRSVYDTWAPEFGAENFANNFVAPALGNGYLPPYDRPVRGVQITIRIWEPRTGLTREFQIVHRFK